MANHVLIFPELSVFWNAVSLLLIFIIAYEMAMLDLDGRQNEQKHLVKIVILFTLMMTEMVAPHM